MSILNTAQRLLNRAILGAPDLEDIRQQAYGLVSQARELVDRNGRKAHQLEDTIAELTREIERLDTEADEAINVMEGLDRLLGLN